MNGGADQAAAERGRLLSRIRRRYDVTAVPVTIGPVSFDFHRVTDPDRVLDQVAEEVDRRERVGGVRVDEPLHLPYWAEVWDSGFGIGQHLVASDLITRNETSVLDLGCGMGLAGTVAAGLGARVLFADLEAPALLFARLNSLPFAAPLLRRRPELRKRYFGVRRYVPRLRTRRLNWQTDRLAERFALVIGADILYERKQWEYLEPFWRAHLAPGGTVLLGEPGRQTGELFVRWIADRGWRLSETAQKVPTREKPVRVFSLTLP